MTFHQDNFLGNVAGSGEVQAQIDELNEKAFFKDGSKSMEGPISMAANTIITIENADFNEVAVGPTPPAGQVSLYAKADKSLYIKDDGGTESHLASGGDVDGPASAVDENLASYDGVTGKIIKDSLIPQANVVTAASNFVNDGVLFSTGTAKGCETSASIFTSGAGTTLNSNQIRLSNNIQIEDSGGANAVTVQAVNTLAGAYVLTLPPDDGVSGEVLRTDGNGALTWVERVSGPASATDEAIARFDTTTGKLLQNSLLTISDTGDISKSSNNLLSEPFSGCVVIGNGAGLSLASGATNHTIIGASAGASLTTPSNSTIIGANAYSGNGSNTTCIGSGAMQVATSATANVAVGSLALSIMTGGDNNIAIGHLAGSAITNSSNNIFIDNTGVLGDSGVTRIGNTSDQTSCWISGIHSVVPTLTDDEIVVIDSSGELGTTTQLTNLTGIDIVHVATEADDHALEIDVDCAGFGDVKALDIIYDTGAITAGTNEEAILINIDETAAGASTRIVGFECVSTSLGSGEVDALEVGATVHPLIQQSGTFADADTILDIAADVTVALSQGGAGNISVFENDNETMTIGDAAKYSEIEIILDTPASGGGVAPTFEYSTGVGTWTAFTPTDGTNGYRNSGIIIWALDDIPGWLVGTGTEFLIRITRTRNSLSTTPIVDLIQISATTEYGWDASGDLTFNSFSSNTIAIDSAGVIQSSATDYIHQKGGVQNFFAGLGAGGSVSTTTNSTGIGYGALANSSDNNANTAVGYNAGNLLNGVAISNFNTFIGYQSGDSNVASSDVAVGSQSLRVSEVGANVAVGAQASPLITTGTDNISLGFQALDLNVSGDGNLGIGSQGGSNLLLDNNICIMNSGLGADTGVIRLGNSTDHSSCFIAGIDGTTLPNETSKILCIDSNDQITAEPNAMPVGYLDGLLVSDNAATTKDISAGSCRSDDNTFNIVSSGVLSPIITTSGAGGLDTGSEAADTWYSIWVIADSVSSNSVSSLLSVSSSAPTMPSGYDKKRRVGWVRNDSSSNFYDYFASRTGKDRMYYWREDIDNVLNGGSSTSRTAVDFSEWAPPTCEELVVGGAYIANADEFVSLYPNATDYTSENSPWQIFSGGTIHSGGLLFIPCNASQNIYYENSSVGDSAYLSQIGFVDSL